MKTAGLATALLTAAIISISCGSDKPTPEPSKITVAPAGTTVHAIVVSPPAVTLNIGDKVTLAASVDADAGVSDRTVTWSSSSTAVATVDANGVVTAVSAGNVSIIAASKADPSVKGAASISVNPFGGTATVTVSSINGTYTGSGTLSSSSTCPGFSSSAQADIVLNVTPAGGSTTSGSGTSSVTHKNAGVTFTHPMSCTSDGQSVSCSGSGTSTLSGTTYTVEDIEKLLANVLTDTQTLTNQSTSCKAIYNFSISR